MQTKLRRSQTNTNDFQRMLQRSLDKVNGLSNNIRAIYMDTRTDYNRNLPSTLGDIGSSQRYFLVTLRPNKNYPGPWTFAPLFDRYVAYDNLRNPVLYMNETDAKKHSEWLKENVGPDCVVWSPK